MAKCKKVNEIDGWNAKRHKKEVKTINQKMQRHKKEVKTINQIDSSNS